MILTAVF